MGLLFVFHLLPTFPIPYAAIDGVNYRKFHTSGSLGFPPMQPDRILAEIDSGEKK
jgi:hypothetical protein